MTNEIEASNKIACLAAKALKLKEMREFQLQYSNTLEAYQNSPLVLFSTIKIGALEAFQTWRPYLVENKVKLMPLIVSKMLRGDILAFGIYQELTSNTIDYHVLHKDKVINAEFQSYGGAEDGLAILNARHWLTTKESADIFSQFIEGKSIECQVNGLLNIFNEYIDCT